jgi:hypothetical protein
MTAEEILHIHTDTFNRALKVTSALVKILIS